MKKLFAFVFLAFSLLATASAKSLDEYIPVLPQVLDKALPVDRQKGYLVTELKNDIYLLTDGIYQSLIITTRNGVILFDAPLSIGPNILKAVAEVSNQPIKTLVYTHSHVDHIGGSQYLSHLPKLTILASEKVAEYLKEKQDPRRLVPTKTFNKKTSINTGHIKIEITADNFYHSNEGDVFVHFPEQKILVVIDSMAPGYVPFMGFDLSSNLHEYIKLYDRILSYDFDIFIGGHVTHTGTRDDVLKTKDYVLDVYHTVKHIHENTNMFAVMSEAASQIGWTNTYLLFKVFLDSIVNECSAEIETRWIDKLAGVDVWNESHCRSMLVYVHWDD